MFANNKHYVCSHHKVNPVNFLFVNTKKSKEEQTAAKIEAFKRVEQELKAKGIAVPDFQKTLDIDSQNWNNWKNRGLPSVQTIIIGGVLGLNSDWIATGKGEKYKEIKKEINHYPLPGQVSDKLGDWDRFATQDQLIKAKLVNWSAYCLNTDSLNNLRELSSMIIPNDIKPSEKSYIIEIDQDIFKSFTSGTQLLIDPDVSPAKNSVVVLSIGDKIPTLVRWNPGFGELQVEPLESGYPNSISLENKAYTLLGVAVYEQQKGRRLLV